jgi:hypothetical protein
LNPPPIKPGGTERKKAPLFEKKRRQKLFLNWDCGVETTTAQVNKVFFATFCSQKAAFLSSGARRRQLR